MTINFDESALIFIYRQKTRRATIENISEMMTYLEKNETDLLELSKNAVRILKEMSDEEFDKIKDLELFF